MCDKTYIRVPVATQCFVFVDVVGAENC